MHELGSVAPMHVRPYSLERELDPLEFIRCVGVQVGGIKLSKWVLLISSSILGCQRQLHDWNQIRITKYDLGESSCHLAKDYNFHLYVELYFEAKGEPWSSSDKFGELRASCSHVHCPLNTT